jgi:uncharacterized protein
VTRRSAGIRPIADTRASADTRSPEDGPAPVANATEAVLSTSWMSPKLVPGDITIAGRGTHALVEIAAGEVVVAFGGFMVDGDVFAALPAQRRSLSIQVADDLYCVGPEQAEPNDMVNHSCDPNCGILGSLVLVAIRPIAAGEELCYDYAMSDGSPYDEFACSCGTAMCRGQITGNDWSRPELIERYRGWFSAYLHARIDRLAASASPGSARNGHR